MRLFIFKSEGGEYISVDEKTAHNYLRHPSRWQRNDLKYKGVIDDKVISENNRKVFSIIKEKYGASGVMSDELVEESRREANEMLQSTLIEEYEKADKSILPRNFDWMDENGNLLSNPAAFAGYR